MGCAQTKENQCTTETKSVNRVSLIKQVPKPRIRHRRNQLTEEDANEISASFSERSISILCEPSISITAADAEKDAHDDDCRKMSCCSTSTAESSLYPKRRLRRRRSQDSSGSTVTRSANGSTSSDDAGNTILSNPLSRPSGTFTLFNPLGASQGERPVCQSKSPLSFNISKVSLSPPVPIHLTEGSSTASRSVEEVIEVEAKASVHDSPPLPEILEQTESGNFRDRRTSGDAPPELNNTASYVEVSTTAVGGLHLGPLLATLDSPDPESSLDPEDCLTAHHFRGPRGSRATTLTQRSTSTSPQSLVPDFDESSTSHSQGKLSPTVMALFQKELDVADQDDQRPEHKKRPARRNTTTPCSPLVLDPHAATPPKCFPSEPSSVKGPPNSLSSSCQSPGSSMLSAPFTLAGGMEFVLVK